MIRLHPVKQKTLVGMAVLVTFLIGSRLPSLAELMVIRYNPPNRGQPSSGIRGSGSRGCPIAAGNPQGSADALLEIILLIPNPKDHIGSTMASNPSFYWYVSTVPTLPMEFSLVEPNVPKPIWVESVSVKQPGLVEVSLPKTVQLEIGKRYRWSVSLICDPERRSKDIYVQGFVDRVAPPPTVVPAAANQTLFQQAVLYAEAGLWFDSLAAVVKAQTANPNDANAKAMYRDLLTQIELSELVKAE